MLVFDAGMAHALAAAHFLERSQQVQVVYLSTNVWQQAAVFKGAEECKSRHLLDDG